MAPYQPVFMDGWSPTIREPSTGSQAAIGAVAAEAAMRRIQAQQEVRKLISPFLPIQFNSVSLDESSKVDGNGDGFLFVSVFQ